MTANEQAGAATSAPSLAEQAVKLHARLKALQEPKGYFFSKDTELVMALLEQLLAIKDKEGYMRCPCRIGSGSYEFDKDIVCPCQYREEDVAEFGSCFCGLYVSKAWNEGAVPQVQVPERRPPEKIIF